jgi:hypothetical protein
MCDILVQHYEYHGKRYHIDRRNDNRPFRQRPQKES